MTLSFSLLSTCKVSQCRDGHKCHRSLKEKNTVTKAKSLFSGGFEIFAKGSFHRKNHLRPGLNASIVWLVLHIWWCYLTFSYLLHISQNGVFWWLKTREDISWCLSQGIESHYAQTFCPKNSMARGCANSPKLNLSDFISHKPMMVTANLKKKASALRPL